MPLRKWGSGERELRITYRKGPQVCTQPRLSASWIVAFAHKAWNLTTKLNWPLNLVTVEVRPHVLKYHHHLTCHGNMSFSESSFVHLLSVTLDLWSFPPSPFHFMYHEESVDYLLTFQHVCFWLIGTWSERGHSVQVPGFDCSKWYRKSLIILPFSLL